MTYVYDRFHVYPPHTYISKKIPIYIGIVYHKWKAAERWKQAFSNVIKSKKPAKILAFCL
ncbi:hypothetical protein GCM10026983_12390 [Gracilibacillus alcaliphilus]